MENKEPDLPENKIRSANMEGSLRFRGTLQAVKIVGTSVDFTVKRGFKVSKGILPPSDDLREDESFCDMPNSEPQSVATSNTDNESMDKSDRTKEVSSAKVSLAIDGLADTLAYIIPSWIREEWLGDFRETLHELEIKNTVRWKVGMIAVSKMMLLLYALMRIRIQDLLAHDKREHQIDRN